jgi:hypothetical protein
LGLVKSLDFLIRVIYIIKIILKGNLLWVKMAEVFRFKPMSRKTENLDTKPELLTVKPMGE